MKRFIAIITLMLLLIVGTEAVWADNEVESTEIESTEIESTEVESTETESTETEEPETELPETEIPEPEDTETESPETEITGTEIPEPEEPTEQFVIVIDPGHDAKHAGARGNGIIEENTVLKIGHYLKEELSKYQNVKVYMVREGKECAFPDAKNSKHCNESRIAYAKSVDADVIVSLHLNYHTTTSGKGALILVQNTNYDSQVGKISQALGKKILNGLVELGLYDGGLVKKLSNDTYYPDGSVADYYQILYHAKKVHIPAVIVEHAFVSNPTDVAMVLSSEDGLKALALKDAQGIVEHYGLTLKDGCVAGELPDIQKVPQTQTKPTTEPQPEEKPSTPPENTPETETQIPEETETQLPKETESEMVTEENTEIEEMNSEEDTTQEDTAVVGEEDTFPWDKVAIVVALFAVGGIGGAAGVYTYRKKQNSMHKKDEE